MVHRITILIWCFGRNDHKGLRIPVDFFNRLNRLIETKFYSSIKPAEERVILSLEICPSRLHWQPSLSQMLHVFCKIKCEIGTIRFSFVPLTAHGLLGHFLTEFRAHDHLQYLTAGRRQLRLAAFAKVRHQMVAHDLLEVFVLKLQLFEF